MPTQVVRVGYGLVLLVRPRWLTSRLGEGADRGTLVVARVLGAREVAEGLVLAVGRSRRLQWAGATVDLLHAASMVGLAAIDPGHRRAAATNAAAAAGWAALTVATAPR